MKNLSFILLAILALNACNSNNTTPDDTMVVKDKTIVEFNSPGVVAEKYPSEFFTTKDWKLDYMAPDMKNIYFSIARKAPFVRPIIVFSNDTTKYNVWNRYDFYPASNGNDSILYSKNKYIKKTANGWSKVKSLGTMFEREDWGIMRMSVSDQGTYVFDDYKSNDVIRISRLEDGKRQAPILLSEEINVGKWTAHPFIAPDESYLIWDSEREGGFGNSDIYISFRQKDGSWGKAINLGEKINTHGEENTATITPDGKYMTFYRSIQKTREDGSKYWEGHKYWVKADFIRNLKPNL